MLDTDRVRASTASEINARIDTATDASIRHYAKTTIGAISHRIEELDKEWDLERTLATNAASLALGGLVLSVLHDRRWLVVPTLVMSFLLQHALQGWCPPVPLLRLLGVRTRREIERERYALKAMRGDFAGVLPTSRPDIVLNAVMR
ncbi:MAG TPA: hypothetical protein VFB54_07000 [Burkholderiales bacterium]|nr:hypothetical protein [Burkholderiales bacterium]